MLRLLRLALVILPVTLVVSALVVRTRAQTDIAALTEEVRQSERAFAKTMADRDHTAFASYLADDTVFFGPRNANRGKQAVADAWKPFFAGPAAPFSWEPETVEVLESGTLALSSGPVRDPSGKRTGTFNTVWRRDAGARWKVVFDKGCPPCQCP